MIRAGILVTGTEVISGAVEDRNGPWLARRLQELGVEVAHISTVADRPADIAAALGMMEAQQLDLLVTSGGLGPTADDLTVAAIARWRELPLRLDSELEARIAAIVSRVRSRPSFTAEAMAEGNRKQATVPDGALVLDPVGTAPGLVLGAAARPSGRHAPVVVVLPGPPRELHPMWDAARRTAPMRRLLERVEARELHTMRLFGIPESQLAKSLREAQRAGIRLSDLEITTCQHRGELEVSTRVAAHARGVYAELTRFLAGRHPHELFSLDGSTVDEQVARMLRGLETVAVAESCTGGMLAARLTDLPGSSEYVRGGIMAYADEVKIANVGVPAPLIARHGAVSAEVAGALAEGARRSVGADVGVGVTGIAGPSGGSAEKPVGLVWLSVAGPGESGLIRSVQLPGSRAEVRERAVTVAMHLLLRALAAAR